MSVNPYKELEIYTKNHMERYRGVNFYEVSPHMWVHDRLHRFFFSRTPKEFSACFLSLSLLNSLENTVKKREAVRECKIIRDMLSWSSLISLVSIRESIIFDTFWKSEVNHVSFWSAVSSVCVDACWGWPNAALEFLRLSHWIASRCIVKFPPSGVIWLHHALTQLARHHCVRPLDC